MGAQDSDEGGREVTPLENRAYFDIDVDDGYVRIDQSTGQQVLYTPSEAENIADAIREAAAAASDGG